MEARKFIIIILGLLAAVICGGCLINDVFPENTEIRTPRVEVQNPDFGVEITPPDEFWVDVRAHEYGEGDGIMRVTIQDSVVHEYTFDFTHQYRRKHQALDWVGEDSLIVIKGWVQDNFGNSHIDTVQITVGQYFDTKPELIEPESGKIYLEGVLASIDLEISAYEGGATRSYEFQVASDSLFTADVNLIGSYSRTTTLKPTSAGTLYWRARAVSSESVRSPWSDIRSMVIIDGSSYSQDFLVFGSIMTCANGPDGFFLAGSSGGNLVVMKRGPDFSPGWSTLFSNLTINGGLAARVMENGSVLVGASRYVSYGDSYPNLLVLGEGGGQEFTLELAEDREVTDVALTPNGGFLWATSGGDYQGAIVRTDSSGTVLWSYGGNLWCDALDPDPDSGTIAVVLRNSQNLLEVGELDQDGSLLWKQQYNLGVSSFEGNVRMIRDSDSGFIIGMGMQLNSEHQYIVLKLDSMGTLVWKKYLIARDIRGYKANLGSIRPAPGGGWFLIGTHWRTYSDSDIFLARLDAEGDPVWSKIIGRDSKHEEGLALAVLEDSLVSTLR